jgi:hypothetical protein
MQNELKPMINKALQKQTARHTPPKQTQPNPILHPKNSFLFLN